MQLKSDPKLRPNAQSLRKNMTKEERRLWYTFLRTLPVTVNRQHVIGRFIVDFYIFSSKLVIELDGSQHYEPEGIARDTERDAFLRGLGLTVLRYTNTDVNKRFAAVCDDIQRHLEAGK